MMSDGEISLPGGCGLDHRAGRTTERAGAAPGDRTSARRRDFLAVTHSHACVPARIEFAG